MSSDPFGDLAGCTLRFADALDAARSRDDGAFTASSPAGVSSRVEHYADEWGAHPLRDAYISAGWYSVATTDHLRALAALIPTPLVVFSLWTAARGAMEAAAQGAYIVAPDADDRERVRRHMNDRLLHHNNVVATDGESYRMRQARTRGGDRPSKA